MTPRAAFHITRIGKRNQVTIPAEILRELNLIPGQHVRVSLVDDRAVTIEPAEDPIDRARGFLRTLGLPALTDDELEAAIREANEVAATNRYLRTLEDA